MTDRAFGRALFGDPEPEPGPKPEPGEQDDGDRPAGVEPEPEPESRRRDTEPEAGTGPDGPPAGQQPGPEPEGEQADEPEARGETAEERFNESTVSIARGPARKTEADRRFFEKLHRRRIEDLIGRGGNRE